jgi:hypothetical protein
MTWAKIPYMSWLQPVRKGNAMNEENRDKLFRMLAADADSREAVYEFLETPNMREILKGPAGIEFYTEIIEIADKARAPLDEVRNRLEPLLDQVAFEKHCRKMVNDFVDSGGFERALHKLVERDKAEHQELLRRMDEAQKIFEEEDKKRKGFFGRLFS